MEVCCLERLSESELHEMCAARCWRRQIQRTMIESTAPDR
jgi:hypothetical protein